jgi:thymidylate synthase
MKNGLDEQYIDLLKDILENGIEKNTRNGKVLSVFGRTMRYKFKDGKFPLLTTKKMAFKAIVTELLWFLRGDTSIEYLLKNDCNIWTGDAYKKYENSYAAWVGNSSWSNNGEPWDKENFIRLIKTDERFCKFFGELGPIYGHGWRNWNGKSDDELYDDKGIDQISDLIKQLKENPDSRRLLLSAWNPSDLDSCVLPPCHYGFQVYTRELSRKEKIEYLFTYCYETGMERQIVESSWTDENFHDGYFNVPKRAISLMFNMRSCDTFLGLPFNIASYGLLLEIIAKSVNMVPDELIGNLGDVHLYSNHIEQAKEQIGRELDLQERFLYGVDKLGLLGLLDFGDHQHDDMVDFMNEHNIPTRTRQPYPLPTLNINTEFWPYESGECGVGPLDAVKVFEAFKDDNFCKCLLEEDIQLSNYQSHPTIKAPLSN